MALRVGHCGLANEHLGSAVSLPSIVTVIAEFRPWTKNFLPVRFDIAGAVIGKCIKAKTSTQTELHEVAVGVL